MGRSSLRPWLRRPGKAARRATAARPRVEQLEGRCVPSTLQAISLPPGNQPPSDTAAGPSLLPSVSADGRYVAFTSSAPNLLPGQAGGPGANVFLLDRTAGAVTLVSHVAGSPPTASFDPAGDFAPPLLSRDGRYVTYEAGDDAIVGQPNQFNSIIVAYDRTTGRNTLVSHDNTSPTEVISEPTFLDAMSPNGRYIVFDTNAKNVVPNEANSGGSQNLYEYDQVTQSTQLITHVAGQPTAAEGFLADPFQANVSVADNGTVAFLDIDQGEQLVSGLTPEPINDVFLYSPATQTNHLLSAVSGSPTTPANGCGGPVISEDSSTVAYASFAFDLVANQGGPPVNYNIFRYDVASGTTILVSGAGGSATDGGSGDSGSLDNSQSALALSRDGRFLAFVSQATDLVPGQTGPAGNVFLYDAQGPSLTLLSGVGGSPTAGAGGDATLQPPGTQPDIFSFITQAATLRALTVSDGGDVAFASQATDLVPGQAGPAGIDNVFLYRHATGRTRLVTGDRGSATAGATDQSGFPSLSGDGSVLVYHSQAADLVPGIFDGNYVPDVFAYRPADGSTAVVSRAAFHTLAPGNSYSTSVSADGNFTVFTSTATNLLPNQATINGNQNIFLFDKQTRTITLVNHVPGLAATTGDGGIDDTFGDRPSVEQLPVLSADGSTIAFYSTDDDLLPGEPQQTSNLKFSDVYLYNVATGQIRLVNHTSDSKVTPDDTDARQPAISKDGRYVAYVYGFAPQGAADFNEGAIALYDSLTDTMTLVTTLDSMNQGTADDPTISDDGRFVSYLNAGQVYVYDRVTGNTVLASHDNSSPTSTTPANGASSAPVLSHDGSAVAFVSAATNLVSGQVVSSFTNVFLYQNDTGGADAIGPVRLVSGAGGSATTGGDGNSDSPALSNRVPSDGNGIYVAYRSDATDLVPGQAGPTANVFEFNSQTSAQTLVSHQAGSRLTAAGGVPQPFSFESLPLVIDDDGHLISYASTAGNLVPGQSGPAGVSNIFIWLRQTNANILASGQGGSPTVTGNADSSGPLLTRDSFPGFSSLATNLLSGLSGKSVAYINTLVAVMLSPDTAVAGAAGSVVGQLTVSSLLAGQFLPPVYTLPGTEADNGLFALSGAALLSFLPPSASGAYTVRLHVDVGFGDDPVLLQVFAVPGPPGPTGGGGEPVLAELVSVRVGKHKKTRLMVAVFDPVSGAELETLVCPFQAPAYRNITVTPVGPGLILVSARKGKHKVTALLPV